jgi:hypothetical protein
MSALLLALAILFQNLRLLPFLAPSLPHSTLIIGSLVNMTIIIAVGYVGLGGSIAIAILAPLFAVLQGHLPNIALAPVVMVGNAIMPLFWYIFNIKMNKISQFLSVIIGSCAKFLFLFLSVPLVYRAFVGPNVPALLLTSFSYPQLITALIGGTLAIIILRSLQKE